MPIPLHSIILNDSSLELVPKKYRGAKSCSLFEKRFGIPPEMQILDDNFHHDIVKSLPHREKRGRPDIVHFACLDVTSTPAYLDNLVRLFIHTINDETISVAQRVRLPRTELRFFGLMSKILSGRSGIAESELFKIDRKQTMSDLLRKIDPRRTILLTREGARKPLSTAVNEAAKTDSETAWVIGGFARGHFDDKLKSLADEMITISELPLPAHVVTARLCYQIELQTQRFSEREVL